MKFCCSNLSFDWKWVQLPGDIIIVITVQSSTFLYSNGISFAYGLPSPWLRIERLPNLSLSLYFIFLNFLPLNANNARCSLSRLFKQKKHFHIAKIVCGAWNERQQKRSALIRLKCKSVSKKKKKQECGRDLANFYFVLLFRSFALCSFIFSNCRFSFADFFHGAVHASDDDTKHLIICYVTVLRVRIFETSTDRHPKPDDFNVSNNVWMGIFSGEKAVKRLNRKTQLRLSD